MTARRIRFGVMLPMWSYHVYDEVSFEQVLTLTREAERLGYDYVSLDDHLQRGGDGRVLECLSTLSALAGAVPRIRFKTTVLCTMYRPPALVAKMAATIDQISGGRLELGIGAGWKEEEAAAYGMPWDGAKGRLDRLEEACRILLALWTQDEVTFQGRHYRLRGARCLPRPVQRPHPPLWVGGGGEKRTLRIAARYADGADFGGPGIGQGGPADPVDWFVHKREVLHAHCRAVGRDPAEIMLTAGVNIMLWGRSRDVVEARFRQVAQEQGLSEPERQRLFSSLRSAVLTTDQAVAQVERIARAGATAFTIGRPTLEGLQRFAAEVMPHFR
ncbi:MAG: LLM class flavin-dependent oxidoreductase [Armatimonadota bacterium]|jgi:probable F420-dependent oxidoreductase|nr:LLM class flavin-dependent oxidoreductase [Armatimonadota bacterium]MDR7452507.1 LLM class flavin-dependent oxidoreductase [Armatimonadota bacterium]